MAVNPCWDKFKKEYPDLHNYLKRKAGSDFDGSDQSRSLFSNAAKQLQNESLSTLNDVYTGIGVKGFENKGAAPDTQDAITVSEMVDKVGSYKGQRGRFYQDGKAVIFKVEGQPKEYELGNIDEVGSSPISSFDIANEESVVTTTEAGELKVRGENYKNNFSDPLAAINYDKDGNIVSVNLENAEGKKRTFRGNIAEDLAYQIHLQQISNDDATRESFEDYINQDPESQEEMESETLSETAEDKTVEDNEVVSREKIEAKVVEPKVAKKKTTTDKYPTKKEFEKAEQVNSEHDATSRLSNGERIFAVPEMDEQPIELTSVKEILKYAPDQLISIQRDYDPFAKPSSTKNHSENIKDKFRKQFKAKGISDEQIDGAVALMDARAKSWASEEKGRTPEQWFDKIADVKSGEFESADVKYQGGKIRATIIGAMAVLQPMKVADTKAPIKTEQTSTFQSKDEKAIIDILNNYYKENDETPPKEVVNRALYLWDKFGRPEISGDSTKNDDRAFATNEGGKIKLGNITNFDDFVAELSHSAQYVSGKRMDDRSYASQAERDSVEYKRKGSMEYKAHKEVEPILADYIFTGDSSKLNKIQYQEKDAVKHGALETLQDGRVIIHALESPDVSTMVHEIFHVFEKDLTAAEKKQVDEFGGSEAFARAGEKYLRTGVAPNTELEPLFKKFKEWLKNIYKSLAGSSIEKRISPDIKKIFDRLLSEKSAEAKPTAAKPAEAKAAAEPSTSKKIKVFDVSLGEVNTEKDVFQNRETEFSQESVDKIKKAANEGTFNWEEFDPVLLWKNPKDSKLYVLSGHSRLEAFKQLSSEGNKDFDKIPSKIIEGTIDEARQVAMRSNTLGTKESPIERASYYRKQREAGKSKSELSEEAKDNEGRNANTIVALSYLNPKGKAVDSLRALGQEADTKSKANSIQIARWIGETRRMFPQITNEHENEIFDWLAGGAYDKIKNIGDITSRLNTIISRIDFDATRPLNLENKATKTYVDEQYEAQLKEKEDAIKEQQKLIDVKTKRYHENELSASAIAEKNKEDNAILHRLQKDLIDLKNKKSQIAQANKSILGLFDNIQNEIKDGSIKPEQVERIAGLTDAEATEFESSVEALESKAEIENEQVRKETAQQADELILKYGTPPNVTKVGGVDSVVDQVETIGGVKYELFKGETPSEKRAAFKITDVESGNVVTLKKYPTYEQALKEYNKTVAAANASEVTKPISINGNEEESSESGREGREEGGQESHAEEENVKTSEQGGESASGVTPPFISKKAGDAVRKFADKLRTGKINKLGGFKSTTGFDAVWDASLEVVAKALEGGALIADAIQSGLDYIKGTDWYNNLTDKKEFDQKYKRHMEDEVMSTANVGTSESFREKVRGAYRQLMDSDIPEKIKDKFREKGNLKYKVSDNGEAQAAGKAAIAAFGVDEALSLARQNAFHPSVNSAVFSEAINDFYNKEQSAKSQATKFKYATRWADTYNEYAEILTASGQFGQYSYQFYKTSQLGFLLSAKERLDERREHFLAKDEKSLRQAFEELKDLPEFQEIFAQEVQEAAKKSRNEVKKEARKKISDAFDKLKLDKNATYATFVPPPIINGAIEAMKQAVLLGYEVADVIAEGIKYINARYNEGWNQEKFETDFTPIVDNLIAENATKRPSASGQKKILAKWDKRLNKLKPEKRRELLSKVLNEIVKNGGLEYDKFKQMYADALGLPSLTPDMETKLKDLGGKLNKVDEAKENLDKEQSKENVDAFLKAMNEGEKASRQLNDLLGEKGITLDRFLSIAKLNTLGVANLFINPFFNISFMPIRFLESMVKTGLDYGLRYAGFARSDGLYENTFYKQRGYFQGFGKGFRKSIINLYTGDQQFDYFQKTTRQNIQPIESVKEILSHYKGTKRLTTSELANAVMEAFPTMGASAAIISRGLQVGDLPFRFAAERGAAENIASQRGLTGIKKEAFILNPDEESKEKITDAGQRAVMAQDNLLTGALNRLSNYLKFETQGSKARQAAVGIGKIVGATTQPFLKIPLNSAMTTLELAIPEFAVVRGFYHAATGNRELALNAFARAAVGYAIGLALTQMTQAGLVTGTDDDKDKINASIYKGDYVGDKTLNYTGFKRWILGGSPRFEDGDVTISLNVLGVPGAIMQMQAQKYDKMSPEQWEQEGYLANLWERAEGSFVNGLKNNVFGNASTLFSAINDGSTYGMNKWLRGSSNVMLNAFEPQWLSTASRISDKYKADYSAMNLPQQMAATLKERFWNGDDVPKQITVWGQKRTDAPKGTNPFLHYYVDITKSRNVDVNDFGFNILGLYNRTKDDAVIPSRPQKTLNENGQYVRLSPLQYEELQIMVGTQRKQLVQLLMNTDHYNDADDKIKTEMLKKQYQNGFKLGERQFWFKHPDLLPPKKKK